MKRSTLKDDRCYGNALAERVNDILKQEFFPGGTFADKVRAAKGSKQAITLYNQVRLHTRIGYITSEQKHAA